MGTEARTAVQARRRQTRGAGIVRMTLVEGPGPGGGAGAGAGGEARTNGVEVAGMMSEGAVGA